MPVKIQKQQQQDQSLPVGYLDHSRELEVASIYGIYALKPIALQKLETMLESKDSRTVLQAAKLILQFGNT
jgi:hypothetical protein